MAVRWGLTVRGTVQGVGFRPYVHRLARDHGLTGYVANRTGCVTVEIQGDPAAAAAFATALRQGAPALCRIDSVGRQDLSLVAGEAGFTIAESDAGPGQVPEVSIPPDTATCPDCRRETLDPSDRHYFYPFTNCTACGPRFSIIRSLPYDRARTTMAGFPMCEDCAAEYHDPADRRFHAQPVACPACGPRVWLADPHRPGRALDGTGQDAAAVIRQAAAMLAAGRIVAVKGIGGFHLACDATNEAAVAELRRRKRRPHKPLAVMCRDLATAAQVGAPRPGGAALLSSPRAPVVLIPKRAAGHACEAGCPALAPSVAPGLGRVGVMLPYSPLHILLLRLSPPVLVMTSGNRAGLPLIADNETALADLGQIADAFLLHDRPIANRCDDSVILDLGARAILVRRSRGYVPDAIAVPPAAGTPGEGDAVLALGGDMRGAACLLAGTKAVFSQHVGSAGTIEGQEFLAEAARALVVLARRTPSVVACDMHPGYRSREAALGLAAEYGARIVAVQHHHAHFASSLAACGHSGPSIGVVLDGTGYGEAGDVRGFEVLSGDYRTVARHFHLEHVLLPGGDWAPRNPRVSAVGYLVGLLGDRGVRAARQCFAGQLPELEMLLRLLRRPSPPAGDAGARVVPTSSCGRLFDAVAALTGICRDNSYDGRAPSELEALAGPAAGDAAGDAAGSATGRATGDAGPDGMPASGAGAYPFDVAGDAIRPGRVISAVLDDLAAGVPVAVIARRFHRTVEAMVVDAVSRVALRTGLRTVALGGGSWQNEYLLAGTLRALAAAGLTVLVPEDVPVNDGGLALGQAVVAAAGSRGTALHS